MMESTRIIIVFLALSIASPPVVSGESIDGINKGFEPPPSPLDNCQMTEACNLPNYNINSLASGNRIVSYFDPSLECPGSTYPFRINVLWTTYNDVCNPCVLWPFDVDLIIYRPAQAGNPCAGPGQVIYRESFSCDEQHFSYPAVGPLNLTDPLCVEGPFFIGIQYTGQPFGLYPPPMIGDASRCPPVDCHYWGGYGAHWWTWSEYWGAIYGPPAFWIDGEWGAQVCLPQQNAPTLSQWGMIMLGFLLLTCGTIGVILKRKYDTAQNATMN